MTISLITTSFDRQTELDRLIESISRQRFIGEIELIFIGQGSAEPRLAGPCTSNIRIVHRRLSGLTPLSKARNFALTQFSGDIIGFPDDDCWYEPELLKKVHGYFLDYPNVDCICANVFDPVRNLSRAKRSSGKGITFANVIRLGNSNGIFVRRDALLRGGAYFDEGLGLGTRIGSAEETELLARLLTAGCRIDYVDELHVYHALPKYSRADIRKNYAYGVGIGHLNRRLLRAGHAEVLWDLADLLARSVIGTLVFARSPVRRAVYWNRMRGVVSGFMKVAAH